MQAASPKYMPLPEPAGVGPADSHADDDLRQQDAARQEANPVLDARSVQEHPFVADARVVGVPLLVAPHGVDILDADGLRFDLARENEALHLAERRAALVDHAQLTFQRLVLVVDLRVVEDAGVAVDAEHVLHQLQRLLLGLEGRHRVDDGLADGAARAADPVRDAGVELAGESLHLAPGALLRLEQVEELLQDELAALDLTDRKDAERRLDAVRGDLRGDGAGERVRRLRVDAGHKLLDRGRQRGDFGDGPVLAGLRDLGDRLLVDLADARAARLLRADLARGERELLVALLGGGLLAVDRLVANGGLKRIVEEAALLGTGVRVALEIVRAPVVREHPVARRASPGAIALVKLDGIVLVAVRLDVRDLKDSLLQNLEIRRKRGRPAFPDLVRFHARHRVDPLPRSRTL